MNIKKLLLTVIMFASASALPAQGPIAEHGVAPGWNASVPESENMVSGKFFRHSVSVGWSALLPAGDNQFIDRTLPANLHVDYHYHLSGLFSVGADVGYGKNSHAADMRVEYEQDVINGFARKEMTAIPIQVQARYFPLGRGLHMVQPYVSVAAGMQYTKYSITGDNVSLSRMSEWKPVVSAQAAVRLSPSSLGGFFVDAAAGWSYCTSKWNTLHTNPIQNISLALKAGYRF